MGKVFRMNEYDWVFAEDEEQAKTFYEQFIDREEIDEQFEGEVSLQTTMYYEVSKLPIEEQKERQEMQYWCGELCVLKPFEWVIEQENLKAPCIIASTEF